MKKVLFVLILAMCTLGFVGHASAALTYLDFAPLNVWLDAVNSSLTYSFDLDNDVIYTDANMTAFRDIRPGDRIDTAKLGIRFRDDEADYVEQEFEITILDGSAEPLREIGTGLYTDWAGGDVTAYVSGDHRLNVRIDRIFGDFNVESSILKGTFTAVPEPASMSLLGIGILGLLGLKRKKT